MVGPVLAKDVTAVRLRAPAPLRGKRLRGWRGVPSSMFYDDRRMTGLLVWIAVAQFLVFLVVAEAIDDRTPPYNVGTNYISDLGVGSGAAFFNGSIIVLGILILLAVYFGFRTFHDWLLTISLLLAGGGAIGVGIFTEDFPGIHTAVSFITFLGVGLAAIVAYRITKPPLSYIGVVMGILSFLALGLFASGTYLGLGVGGMERMIVLPVIGWALAFGGSLLAPPATASS